MKLYQRYLLAQVRRPWAYILVGFCAIVVLIDLFDNFSDFMDGSLPLHQIALYYSILIPTYLPYMLPVSILLALLYALWNLGKSSEITAMRACGLSLSQIISPFLWMGLVCSMALLTINECFNPWAMHWTRQFREERHDGQTVGDHVVWNIAYMNEPAHRRWQAASFNPRASASYELRDLSITQQRPDDTVEFRLEATRGAWVDGHWWFENVNTRYFDRNNRPLGRVEPAAQLDLTSLSETPRDFIDETKDPETERSMADIRRFLATHNISRQTRNRFLVDYWYRLASPWLCLVVVLLGVPFGTSTSRRGMGMGILFALLSFFGYYVLMSFCLHWGKMPPQALPPFVAAWLPNLLFSTLGVTLLYRIR
ncbi:MAG: LptF/LptG family permease [Kiritimatiellae bacterium]|nr:LptF/LptG family permease [Kiritimatiellia bacterium]